MDLRQLKWMQDAQNSIHSLLKIVHTSISEAIGKAAQNFGISFDPVPSETQLSKKDRIAEASHSMKLKLQMDAWRRNPCWIDEPPKVEVTVPKGSLCQLDSTFKVGIPPDAVFDIITDPENKRVFKNIQAVTYRKVLKDNGERQLVEVEQQAIWRFLWLSGTLAVHVFVDQNRKEQNVNYWLAKEGFMKRFEGSWTIEPFYADTLEGSRDGAPSDRVASLIKVQQIIQPSFVPPPPLAWYVRGITAKTTENLVTDLQAEGKRIREANNVTVIDPSVHTGANLQVNKEDVKTKRRKKRRRPAHKL